MLDFVPRMVILNFAPRDTELTVTLDIISDDIMENVGTAGELFLVRLTTLDNPIHVDLTQNFAAVIILDTPGVYLYTMIEESNGALSLLPVSVALSTHMI